MEIIFRNDNLKDLYINAFTSKFAKQYSQWIIKNYVKCITLLWSLPNSNEIKKFKWLSFEKLNKYKDGDYSIRINNQYRIIFNILKDNNIEIIEITDLTDYH